MAIRSLSKLLLSITLFSPITMHGMEKQREELKRKADQESHSPAPVGKKQLLAAYQPLMLPNDVLRYAKPLSINGITPAEMSFQQPSSSTVTMQAAYSKTAREMLALVKLHYFGGGGVAKNYAGALVPLTEIAQKKDEPLKYEALLLRSLIYYYGDVTTQKNNDLAEKDLKLVVAQNNDLVSKATALVTLGVIYGYGAPPVEKDQSKAIQFLTQAANQGLVPIERAYAQYHLAEIYREQRDYMAALKYSRLAATQTADLKIQKAALCSRAYIYLYLGQQYFSAGEYSKAVEYLELASKQSDDLRVQRMALRDKKSVLIRLNGLNIDYKDTKRATEYWMKILKDVETAIAQTNDIEDQIAATRDQAFVHLCLARCYIRAKDYSNAEKYLYSQAIEKDCKIHEQAICERASIDFDRGRVYAREKNYTEAIKYLQRSAKSIENSKTNKSAQFGLAEVHMIITWAKLWLGEIYYGMEESNYATARDYFKEVANQEQFLRPRAAAFLRLGCIYLFGDSTVKSNYSQALGFLIKAANQKDNGTERLWAWFRLGELFYYGDTTVGKDWYIAQVFFSAASRRRQNSSLTDKARPFLEKITLALKEMDENSQVCRKMEAIAAQLLKDNPTMHNEITQALKATPENNQLCKDLELMINSILDNTDTEKKTPTTDV